MNKKFDNFLENFEKGGFLYRTDDGVSPQTQEDVLATVLSRKTGFGFFRINWKPNLYPIHIVVRLIILFHLIGNPISRRFRIQNQEILEIGLLLVLFKNQIMLLKEDVHGI